MICDIQAAGRNRVLHVCVYITGMFYLKKIDETVRSTNSLLWTIDWFEGQIAGHPPLLILENEFHSNIYGKSMVS